MLLTFQAWLEQIRAVAVEGFFFSSEAAAQLIDRSGPNKRACWEDYYDEGFGPLAALEEDLDNEVRL